jgi:bifunctional non-homologous end joining protein LigD
MRAVALRRPKSRSFSAPLFPDARKAAFPNFIAFCDPSQKDHPPPGSDWVYEIKTDGYRAQLHIHGGEITVYSRRL